MADVKINDLAAAGSVTPSMQLETDLSGFTPNKITVTQILAFMDANITFPADAVDSVNTQTGAVVLDADDVSDSATTNKYTTAGDITKLSGIATAATANAKASEAEVFTGTDDVKFVTPLNLKPREFIAIAVSDETTDLTTGTAKTTFRVPYAFEISAVRASVTTAPTGSVLTVDINEGGSTILSTKITIDATEKTSTTAATAPVISDTTLADDAEITIDIDGIGSTIAGAGLKVYLIGNRT